jgi:hypothetical protein
MEKDLSEDLKSKLIMPSISSLTLQNSLINDIIDFS